MTYRLNEKQYQAVRRLPPNARYAHLVKRAADHSELWALESPDGWVLGADDQGREFLPVWPHPKYAEASATGGWAGSTPVAIEIHDWLAIWTPELIQKSKLVGIFPVENTPAAAIDPSSFAADLEEELSLME